MYIPRHLHSTLRALMQQFPAVLVTGPRQVGKSTLLQQVAQDYAYASFDDPLLLAQAKEEPQLFLLNYPDKVILDEVQYAPELFSLLKLTIDKQQRNGLFLLSGSQAFELMQNVSETLAGRIAILKLSGLSLREISEIPLASPLFPVRYLKTRSVFARNRFDLAGDSSGLYAKALSARNGLAYLLCVLCGDLY